MEKKIANDCSIIVSSYDAYSDVWEPFFCLFFRYWPDCPFPIYLISETKKYPDSRVKTINIGEDKKWATNTKKALGQINTRYILNLLEDFLFTKKVDTERIINLLNILKKNNAGCLKLDPTPLPDKKYKNYTEVGEISKDVNYSVSLLAGFWNKKIFEKLIKDGESAWQMEIVGSKRAINIQEPFLSTYDKPILYFYPTAIKRGSWFYDAAKFCKREGVGIDKNKRRVETFDQYCIRIICHWPILGRYFSFVFRRFGWLLDNKIIRYFFSGGMATATNLISIFILTDIFHIWYVLSSVFAFVLSLFVSFYMQKNITFRDESNGRTKEQFTAYFVVTVANLLLNTAMIYLLVEFTGLYYLYAQILTSIFIATESYFVYNLFIFNR